MAVFVTSDTHFGHKNIATYCTGRQAWAGSTVQEHDAALIAWWNRIVSPEDTVLHCGDFSFHPTIDTTLIRQRLHGRLWRVLGNHDRTLASADRSALPGDYTGYGLWLTVGGKLTVLRHMPTVGDPGSLGFTHQEAAMADALWHGHLHDRPWQPPTPKHRLFGIDTPEPFVRIDEPVNLVLIRR